MPVIGFGTRRKTVTNVMASSDQCAATGAGNQCRVRLQKEQTDSITGTSISTPATVANPAAESGPNSAIAVATASSKKLLAPIGAPGAATSVLDAEQAHQAIRERRVEVTCIRIGIAISATWSGLPVMLSAWNAKINTSVASRAAILTGAKRDRRTFSNHAPA